MTIMDPLADMFTRIRNSHMARKKEVELPYSKFKFELCRILAQEGYIVEFKIFTKDLVKKFILVKLKYSDDSTPVIKNITKISKSSCRKYLKKSFIPKVLNGYGIILMSTSKGVMTGRDARKNNVGGEPIAEVW